MTDDAPTTNGSGLNTSHVVAASTGGVVLVDALADTYHWILTWPIHAPSVTESHSLALLTLAALGGSGLAYLKSRVATVVELQKEEPEKNQKPNPTQNPQS